MISDWQGNGTHEDEDVTYIQFSSLEKNNSRAKKDEHASDGFVERWFFSKERRDE